MALRTAATAAALCFLVAAASAATCKDKPSYLTTCYLKEADFDQCTLEEIRVLFTRLVTGFPEIGARPLDPLDITEIKVLAAGNGPVAVNSTLRDVKITGLSKAIVESYRFDPNTMTTTGHYVLPTLRLDGKYSLNGRVLVLPLKGHGDFFIEPKNTQVDATFFLSLVQKHGKRYFHVDNSKVNFTTGGLKMYFGNLYNGQKALEESTNQYLNENWELALDSMKPILTDTMEDLMETMLRPMLGKVEADCFVGDIEECQVCQKKRDDPIGKRE